MAEGWALTSDTQKGERGAEQEIASETARRFSRLEGAAGRSGHRIPSLAGQVLRST